MSTKKSNLSYICIYYSYLSMFDKLSDQELGEVINALLDYVENGKMAASEGGMRGLFNCMVHQIKLDERKYQKRCKTKGDKSNES